MKRRSAREAGGAALLLLTCVVHVVTDGVVPHGGGAEEDAFAADAEEPARCARLRADAPEDSNSGFVTFVAARPSVVLDLSQCTRPAAAPRVNLAASAHARAAFTQGGWDAQAVVDGIADEPDNGWAYLGRLDEANLTLTLAAGTRESGRAGEDGAGDGVGAVGAGEGQLPRAARVVIVSGSGRDDHHLTAFRIWAALGDGAGRGGGDVGGREGGWDDGEFTSIPGLLSQKADVSVADDGVSVFVKEGAGEVTLDFLPVVMRALRIKVDGSDAAANSNAIINEIEGHILHIFLRVKDSCTAPYAVKRPMIACAKDFCGCKTKRPCLHV